MTTLEVAFGGIKNAEESNLSAMQTAANSNSATWQVLSTRKVEPKDLPGFEAEQHSRQQIMMSPRNSQLAKN